MSLPELLANPSAAGGQIPLALAHLTAAITTTPAAGTVEQWTVDTPAPAALQGAYGRFRAVIDGEIVIVWASSTGASPWNVVRGAEGTTPATHLNGAPIYHLPTAGSMYGYRRPVELRSRLSSDLIRSFQSPGPADNPAVSVSAANANSAITGAASLTGFTVLPNDSRIRIVGSPGPLQQVGAGYPNNLIYNAVGGKASGTVVGNRCSYGMVFDAYCSQIQLACYAQGQYVNVYVNGVKQTVPQLANDASQRNILLDWTGTTGLGLRRIRIENSAGEDMLGFYLAATEDILTPDIQFSPLRMMVFGDSWTDGTGTGDGISSYGVLAGKMLGIDDVWQAGIGGSGYLNVSSQGDNFGPRIATDLLPYSPDIVLCSYGSDDVGGYTTAQVAAAATSDWEQIKGAFPDCLLVVMGPYACPYGGGSPNYATFAPMDTALQAAAAAVGVRYISSIQEKWITGTGYQGATNGTGTSDTLIYTDGIHPSAEGHQFVARRCAYHLQQFLQTL